MWYGSVGSNHLVAGVRYRGPERYQFMATGAADARVY